MCVCESDRERKCMSERINTCMQVFISMQTGLILQCASVTSPCITTTITSTARCWQRPPQRLIPLDNSVQGLGVTGMGSLLDRSSSTVCVGVCCGNFENSKKKEVKERQMRMRKETADRHHVQILHHFQLFPPQRCTQEGRDRGVIAGSHTL